MVQERQKNELKLILKYEIWLCLVRVNCGRFWVLFCLSTGEWGDWRTQHLRGRRSGISAPYRIGAHLIEESDLSLHQALDFFSAPPRFSVSCSLCLFLLLLSCYVWQSLPPTENVPSLCVCSHLRHGEAARSLWPLTLYLTTEGDETTQPGSDNILFCCICCLFVHFNNSYKIKKSEMSWFSAWLCYVTIKRIICTSGLFLKLTYICWQNSFF